MLGGQPISIPLPLSQCVVPDGINGPVGIWITSDGQPLVNNVRDRAETQLVAGPTMAFIDTQPQSLGQLVRGSGSSGSSGSGATTTTATISPAEASAIIASASPTATASAGGSSDPNPAANLTPGKANLFKGPSPDGKLTVVGWTGLSPSQ